ncbi:MAG: glycosyltransferase family 8 protein [Acidimicrobiales bacterium]
MHIAIVTDKSYLAWSATTIASCAVAWTRPGLCVHVLHSPDVGVVERRRLEAMVGDLGAATEFHPVDESMVSALPSKGQGLGGRMSWVRVLLPQLLPELDRVVYLDGDTLIVDAVEDLWALPLGDAPVAAVANVTDPPMYPHVESLGIEDPKSYFNAGVLVVNLRRWREEAATSSLIRFVTARTQPLPWFDQDALNAVFAGRWMPLHPRWNAMNSLWTWGPLAVGVFGDERVRSATTHPVILHFEGPTICKPWHYLCEHPWRGEYRTMLHRTPWADTALEDRTLATRLIALLPRHRRVEAFVRLERARKRSATMRGRLTSRAPADST